jgi:hypothetical protein
MEMILENATVLKIKGLSAETRSQGGKAKKRHSRDVKVVTWVTTLYPGPRVYETEDSNTKSKYKKKNLMF